MSTQSQTVLFKPRLGLFKQPKMLPARYMPITIELELVHDPNDTIVAHSSVGEHNTGFNAANTNYQWQVENVQVKVHVVTLDNQLDNSHAEHLLSGKALPIITYPFNYHTYVSQKQSI